MRTPADRPFPPRARVWGLTGGVAAGKSTLAKLFAEAGVHVIDADAISRSLSAPGGAAHAAILSRFGTADRGELRKKVFADPAARKDLEAILHPMIRDESSRQVRDLVAREPGNSLVPVLYEAALLVEAGRSREFEGLIVVEAPRAARIERLVARDGISPALAEQMIDAQISDQERRKAATVVIVNSSDPESLADDVQGVLARILGL